MIKKKKGKERMSQHEHSEVLFFDTPGIVEKILIRLF
jgi:hypothetical protein